MTLGRRPYVNSQRYRDPRDQTKCHQVRDQESVSQSEALFRENRQVDFIDADKAALSSHPDKVAEEERAEAEIKFKLVGKAYEILYDEDKRQLYDKQGMSAFDGSQGSDMGPGVDLDEMLQQMFMGGGMPSGFGGASPRRPRKGRDEEQSYQVTLEELYKGKSVKFASTKNIICTHCKGSGGKEKAKPKQCNSCQGRGKHTMRSCVTQDRYLTGFCQVSNKA